jgi:hypothetical protein
MVGHLLEAARLIHEAAAQRAPDATPVQLRNATNQCRQALRMFEGLHGVRKPPTNPHVEYEFLDREPDVKHPLSKSAMAIHERFRGAAFPEFVVWMTLFPIPSPRGVRTMWDLFLEYRPLLIKSGLIRVRHVK